MSVKGDILGRVIPPLVIVGGLAAGGYILYKKGVFTPVTDVINTVSEVPQKIIEKTTEVIKNVDTTVNEVIENTDTAVNNVQNDIVEGWAELTNKTTFQTPDGKSFINYGTEEEPRVWSDPDALINTGQKLVRATPAYQIGKKLFGWD